MLHPTSAKALVGLYLGLGFQARSLTAMLIPGLMAYASAGAAAVLTVAAALRARGSRSRWAFAAGMAGLAIERTFAALAAQQSDSVQRWEEYRQVALSFLPLAWVLFSLTYARGDDRTHARQARGLLTAAAILPWLYCVVHAVTPALKRMDPSTEVFRLSWPGMALHSAVLFASVAVVMNLERTFRASVGTMRWRIKFMVLGVGVLFLARLYTSSQAIVFRALDPRLNSIDSAALILAAGLILRSFSRAGHFDIDVYPSQSVLQGSLTIVLAGVYLVILGALAKFVTYYGGDQAFALKAFFVLVAIVGLAIALQSDHARLRLRTFISRHFQRPVHDYRGVWTKFATGTATCVQPGDLATSVATMTAEVFDALSVNVWWINEKKDAFFLAGSTSRSCKGASFATAEIIDRLGGHPEPVDIETSESWSALLRENNPSQFPHGGHRLCAPLMSRGELLGLIILGDRVGGMPWSLQDIELLRCIADHTAASLMNAQLSQRLLQAKELEAFQSMAAFFVHDLKNAASTLNLMLQNLPVHYDNPEFRADALRGIAKTVTHINALISRLGVLRHELKIHLADGDLNDVVSHALAGLDHASATLETETKPLPRIPLDSEQIDKVVTNLVLNATQAVGDHGRVRIATGQENGWVVLTVNDNGCGMTSEFLNQSLFRPFQTTKRTGLGIGMFQSKMIVEAHGGRITVASKPGEGTTFRVFLRAPASSRP